MVNVCSRCGREYKYRRNLTAHERVHNGTFRFRCCGTGYVSFRSFKRHRCTSHGDDKNFVCGTCGKLFATKYDLAQHEKREKTPTFEFNTCDHKTATRDDHNQHLQTHFDQRKAVCATCGARFKHSSSLFRHKRNANHH